MNAIPPRPIFSRQRSSFPFPSPSDACHAGYLCSTVNPFYLHHISMKCKETLILTLRSQSSKFCLKQPWQFFLFFFDIFFEIPEYRSKGAAKNGCISCSPFTMTSNAFGPFLGRMFKSLSTFFRRVGSAFVSSSFFVSSSECNLGNSFITSKSRWI